MVLQAWVIAVCGNDIHACTLFLIFFFFLGFTTFCVSIWSFSFIYTICSVSSRSFLWRFLAGRFSYFLKFLHAHD